MLLAYETVTIINREDEKNWTYQTIKGVSWHHKTTDTLKRFSGKGAGITESESVVVRIPKDKTQGYVSYRNWKNLSEDERAEKWTVKAGDYLVRGVWEPEGSINFPQCLEGYEYFVIGEYVENFRQQMNPHLRIKSAESNYWGRV